MKKEKVMDNEIESMVRDFTQVVPRPKSEVRSRLLSCRNTILEEEKEKLGAFLQKLAWKEKEIQDAFDWIERTPLRLQKNFTIISKLTPQ